MMTTGMYSSKTPEWATPQVFFDALNKEFDFTLDPCATKENAKTRRCTVSLRRRDFQRVVFFLFSERIIGKLIVESC